MSIFKVVLSYAVKSLCRGTLCDDKQLVILLFRDLYEIIARHHVSVDLKNSLWSYCDEEALNVYLLPCIN